MNNGNIQKVRDEVDQHVIAGVLTASLKDLHSPVMIEVYNDVLNTDITEDTRLCMATIRNWIVKIPSPRFEIIKQIFSLLHKLTAPRIGGISDSNPTQLAFNLSPFICRPFDSAYMSIRHMEDLLKIRPVIAFMIENFNEIMTKDLCPRPPVETTASSIVHSNSTIKLPSPIRNQSHKHLSDGAAKHYVSYPFPPNIQIPFEDEKIDNHSSNNNNFVIQDYNDIQHASRNINFQSWEWKMLETLTVARLGGILKESTMRNSRTNNISSFTSTGSGNVATKKIRYETKQTDDNNEVEIDKLRIDSDNKNIEHLDHYNKNNNYINNSVRFDNSNIFNIREYKIKKESRGTARRRMVAECKSLKTKISQFEEKWYRDNNRTIKNSDRGPMQTVYTKYRDIKKAIRDHAATDIQRYIRGYLCRSTKKNKTIFQVSDCKETNSTTTEPIHFLEAKVDQHLSKIPVDIYSKYRELLGEKRDLKRKLKRFDEDFESQHGRVPNRSDKEVMRPLYQKYHDVKNQLDELKAKIEACHGPLPEEFNEGGNIPHVSNNRLQVNSFNNVRPANEKEGSFFDSDLNEGGQTSNAKVNTLDIELLQTEKRDLHCYLKAYERDFTQTHGRQVMKHEDIAPVAREYERYKELKLLLSSLK